MMIPCNYYINVAKQTEYPRQVKRYVYYCNIELGDILPENARAKYKELKAMFPEPLFELTLHYVECKGTIIEGS